MDKKSISTGKKKRDRMIIIRRIFVVFALISLPFITQGTWNMYQSFLRARTEAENEKQEHENLVARRESVKKSLDAISTRAGMEGEIRKRFDVGQEGEELIIVIDRPAVEENTPLVKKLWWEEWRDKLKTFLY